MRKFNFRVNHENSLYTRNTSELSKSLGHEMTKYMMHYASKSRDSYSVDGIFFLFYWKFVIGYNQRLQWMWMWMWIDKTLRDELNVLESRILGQKYHKFSVGSD